MADFWENYKDPRWQKCRLQIMERDEFKCRMCHRSDVTLNVHHAYYERGKKPWEYDDDILFTFCEECHKTIEFQLRWIKMHFCLLWPFGQESILGYMAGQLIKNPMPRTPGDQEVFSRGFGIGISDALEITFEDWWLGTKLNDVVDKAKTFFRVEIPLEK
jgi:hypothetical protein